MALKAIAGSVRWSTDRPDSLAFLATTYAPELQKMGFKLTDQTTDRMVFTNRYLPALGVFLGIITFPIGILFWAFWRREESLTFTLSDDGDGTRVLVAGRGDLAAERFVESMQSTPAASLETQTV